MVKDGDPSERAPSLVGQVGGALRRLSERLSSPSSYGPALVLLAAIPGVTTSLAIGVTAIEAHRADRVARLASGRIAAIAEVRRNAERRAAIAPYLAAPTLTSALAEAVSLLPPDAVLAAISRDHTGMTRIEVDCPDPDALLRAFRPPAARRAWRSVTQSVAAGAGVRVTLEASDR